MAELEVKFDVIDRIDEPEAKELINLIRGAGADASISQTVPTKGFLTIAGVVAIIAVSTASVAVLSVVAVFIYRVFHRGVILDLTHATPQIRKAVDLPRGSLLILYADGRQELRQAISDESVGKLMKAAIDAAAGLEAPSASLDSPQE